jgi:hypothetical protein
MADILGGLQGLLAGLGQGLQGFSSQRQQALENEQKARQIQVQEAEQKRLQQGQEFDRLKAAYSQLMGDQDLTAEESAPYRAVGLPFIKNPETGMLRRPESVEEQVQKMSINLPFQGQLAQTKFAPQAQEGQLDRQNALALAAQRAQADQTLAGINNAADLQQTNISAGAQKYSADRMYDRVTDAAGMKPIDPKSYNDWKMTYFATSPGARDEYNKAVREFGADIAESVLLDQFKANFRPQQ